MNSRSSVRFWSILFLIATVFLFTLSGSACRQSNTEKALYRCPMHPTVVSDRPGDCPICGMKLVALTQPPKAVTPADPAPVAPVAPAVTDKKILYTCPMHAQVISENPKDRCPLCGMELVPKTVSQKETSMEDASTVAGLAPVEVSAENRRRLGMTFEAVRRRNMRRELRTTARLTPDETRLSRVSAKMDGWVEKLFVNTTGQAVRQGEPLFAIYSQELLATQQELLAALSIAKKLSASPFGEVTRNGVEIVDAARQRLRLWDISEEQIRRLETGGQVEKQWTIYSPSSGVVWEKMVLAGQKVSAGESLLVIADLERLWGLADLYESDLPYAQVGMQAELTFPYWKEKRFHAEVVFLEPTLNAQSRTVKARLSIPNADGQLRPEMYAEALLWLSAGRRPAVPEGAVLMTGENSYVFRETSSGRLQPVKIAVGMRSEGYYEILSGLREGDRVLTSANFLVDSESALKAALEAVGKE